MYNDFKPEKNRNQGVGVKSESPSAFGNQRRRFPRVFLAAREELLSPMSGVLLALPDRTHLPVLGMSSAGIMISPVGILGKIRLGQIMDCKLRFAIAPKTTDSRYSTGATEPLSLRLRVIRLTATVASLALDSLNFEDRLRIEQSQKDHFIFSNIQAMETKVLPVGFHEAQWYSGPFDTNFLFWQDSQSIFQRAIFEYDGVILTVDSLNSPDPKLWNWWLKRSMPAVDEARGYAAPWQESEAQKISMGASWRMRLIRLLETTQVRESLVHFKDILAQI